MPMTPVSLAARIRAQLVALPFIAPNADLDSYCLAIATATIAEITANGTVMPTALVAPSGGGPVTGTGKVT